MIKLSQTPSKTKSSSNPGSISKGEKAKPMKNMKSSFSFAPPPVVSQPSSTDISTPLPTVTLPYQSSVASAPPSSTHSLPPSPKTTTQSTLSTPHIASKPTKVKPTSRKSVKSRKPVDSATAKGEPAMKD